MNNIILKLKIIILALLITACTDIIEEYYTNYADVVKSGDLEKGWIPSFLPESAYDIYDKHNLDTNEIWIRFHFNKIDLTELTNVFELLGSDEQNKIAKILNSNFSINKDGIIYYKYSKEEFVAINSKFYICYYCKINFY